MATAAELQARDRIFIGGEWVEPHGTDTFEVVNSTSEEVMGTIPACTADDVDLAVRAARDAFDTWAQTPREERAALLAAIACLVTYMISLTEMADAMEMRLIVPIA